MKFFAINGSPRKDANTAQVLNKALEGVKSVISDCEVEVINLYELNFTGCKSCFACKKIGGAHYGMCPLNDELNPKLKELVQCDGIILGSPIYFGDLTGEMRSFLERLMFPHLVYDKDSTVISPKKMPIGLFLTMNVTEEIADDKNFDYKYIFSKLESILERIFKKPYIKYVYNTYQFSDYSKYESSAFDENEKAKYKEEQFPKDLEDSFNIGVKIANDAMK